MKISSTIKWTMKVLAPIQKIPKLRDPRTASSANQFVQNRSGGLLLGPFISSSPGNPAEDNEHGDNVMNNNEHGDQISFEEDEGGQLLLTESYFMSHIKMVMTMMMKKTWKTEKLVTWIL